MSKKFKHYEQVLVRNREDKAWRCDLYSHYREVPCTEYHHSCIGGDFKFCIPYKGNEHLVGTCETPKQEEGLEFGDKVMVRDDSIDWKKATFVSYLPDNTVYYYRVCTPNGVLNYKHCRKGWEDEK